MLRIKILIPIIATVAAAAIVGLLAFQVWNPSWNPFGASPQERLEKSFQNLFFLKSFRIDGNLELKFTKKTKEEEKESFPESFLISFLFSQKFDKSDKDTPKSEGAYTLSFGGEGMEISFRGEAKTIGETLYLKLTSLPAFSLFEMSFGEFKNQWIKIDKKGLEKITGQEIKENEKEKQDQLIKEITQLFAKREIFEIKKVFGKEKVNNKTSFHYLVNIKKEELKQLIPQFLRIIEKYSQQESQEIENFLKDFPEKFEEFFKKIGGIDFEVWIDRDNNLQKIKFEKEIDLELIEEIQDPDLRNTKLKIVFDGRFSEFNQKIKIEPPKEFKLIEEILPSK